MDECDHGKDNRARLFIGTSGWSYQHWRGVFYPEELDERDWLGYYASVFDTVELNNSFYRLPDFGQFRLWKEQTPPGFTFAVKASRFITHLKKLNNVEDGVERMMRAAGGLELKLGPILFQFPGNWKANPARLRAFVNLLPKEQRFAFEFRNGSWFTEEIFETLRQAGAAICISDSSIWPSPYQATAGFVFIRLHGGHELYSSDYTERELVLWAQKIADFLNRRFDVYAYFNNDAYGYAVNNAGRLRELLTV